MNISTNVADLAGVGQATAERLHRLGIKTLDDLFKYYPRNYLDFSERKLLLQVQPGDECSISGTILSIVSTRTKQKNLTLQKAVVSDDSGRIEIVWFNQPYLLDQIKVGMHVVFAGKIEGKFGKLSLNTPFFEIIKDASSSKINRILPVYRETEGLYSSWLRKKIETLFPLIAQYEEWLPDEILVQQQLMTMQEALIHIHFPRSKNDLEAARRRIAFDELFLLQLKSLTQRIEWQSTSSDQKAIIIDDFFRKIQPILELLPFTLTDDQKQVLDDIASDLNRGVPALRLIEGEVGSGKTIVAILAAWAIVDRGAQVAIMVPTEVLARQHLISFSKYFHALGKRVELLVGSMTDKQKRETKEALATGRIDVIIGTHALIEDDVLFSSLGLVVIDEQHRFGVQQRSRLKAKGNPHLLSMTATPIPRTLALTLYGDQDLSIIRHLPPGRKEIITKVISPQYRVTANRFIADQIQKGRQIYVICPLVEESETLEVKSAIAEYERLRSEVFPEFRVVLLHGRMKAEEKNQIMSDFKAHQYDILVSTSVIEVGIDVPNASIIVIEGAERFGLAQLHQFRGRVGRGEYQSYCLLFTSKLSQQNRVRMKAMMDYASGFDLAEIDLEIRGPGEVFGTKQSGIPDLKMADLSDRELLTAARKSVDWLLEKDPQLEYYFRTKSVFERFLNSQVQSDMKV